MFANKHDMRSPKDIASMTLRNQKRIQKNTLADIDINKIATKVARNNRLGMFYCCEVTKFDEAPGESWPQISCS